MQNSVFCWILETFLVDFVVPSSSVQMKLFYYCWVIQNYLTEMFEEISR